MTKRFEITDTSLKVEFKKPMSFIGDEFTFEEITKKYTRKKSPNLFTLIPGLACCLGIIITLYSHFNEKNGSSIADILFYVVISGILLGISALNIENVVFLYLVNGRTLTFYANSPNRHRVNEFFEQLFVDQKKYLLKRYAKADPYISHEQTSANLKWLRDRNIIDDEELSDLQAKCLPKPGGSSLVGFTLNPEIN